MDCYFSDKKLVFFALPRQPKDKILSFNIKELVFPPCFVSQRIKFYPLFPAHLVCDTRRCDLDLLTTKKIASLGCVVL